MDSAFLQIIIENNYKLPKEYTVAEITPQLISNLGSTESYVRENSYMIFCDLINAGVGVNYSPEQLREIWKQMAHNLTNGIGETESDSVFVRAFSILVLDKLIALDEVTNYLTEPEIRELLEQGLVYLAEEKDLRGQVPQKGWVHAIAHTGDFFWVITRNRFMDSGDLKRILNAIADKVTEPAERTYLYQEDDRLAQAVISALLRNLLDIDFLKTWLERFVNPPSGIVWREAFSYENNNNARYNTITFLRSLYFQLLLGIQYVHHTYANKTPKMRDELLSEITSTLKTIDHWVYANED
jgi:hypothetical protein